MIYVPNAGGGCLLTEPQFGIKAKDLFDIPSDSPEWGKTFLKRLECEYLDKVDPLCSTELPMEGIVVSRQIPFKWEAYKLKDLKFLGLETQMLDKAE